MFENILSDEDTYTLCTHFVVGVDFAKIANLDIDDDDLKLYDQCKNFINEYKLSKGI